MSTRSCDPCSTLGDGVNLLFIIIISFLFFYVLNDSLNKRFVFLLFRSPYAHLPHPNRASATSVSVKSIRSLHEAKICSPHRFYDS